MNVIALFVPLINVAGARRNFVPFRILVGKIAVKTPERLRCERRSHGVANLLQGGPEVAQEGFFSCFIFPERFARKIQIHAPGQGKGHDERRRHEKIRLDVLVHPRFEVAVSGQNGGGHEIVVADGLLNFRMERAGVSDAGGATVADNIEAELIEVRLQAGLVQVIRNHP